MKKNNAIIIAIVMLLVGGGAGFFIGKSYQQNQRSGFASQFANGQGQIRNGQGMGNASGEKQVAGNGMRSSFRPVIGEIISADDKSITVKLQDGSSKIVLFSSETAINKSEAGSTTDLKTGTKVLVNGQANSDGSVNAQNIQLNPVIRTMPASTSAK
jgi:hypothetical protein